MRASRDVVQISGGEPTIHPEFFCCVGSREKSPHPALDAQHRNGIRIAKDEEFTRRLVWVAYAGLRALSAIRLLLSGMR